RDMRNNPTEPEKRLWRHLSGSKLEGHKFRRQAVVGHYIADFLCPQKKLIVEVDGDTHDLNDDANRDAALRSFGYQVVRVTNQDVMHNMDGVLTVVLNQLTQTANRWHRPLAPSSEGEGEHALSPSPSGEGFGVGPCEHQKGL
ncbi:MAG: endonuclease domain-containing protein, partial [Pseudomonadota bacterium]